MSEPPLKVLKNHLKQLGYDGLVLPMADAFQTESLSPAHRRIEYLTGFKGSYGYLLVLPETTGLFVDGRYTLQAQNQVNTSDIQIHPHGFPSIKTWLGQQKVEGLKIAYDPWIQTVAEISHLETMGKSLGVSFVPHLSENIVDQVWKTRPSSTEALAEIYPSEYAGEESSVKIQRITDVFPDHKIDTMFLGHPESICWLLNFRGKDTACTPIAYCYALLHKNASLDLFIEPGKISSDLQTHLGPRVTVRPLNQIQGIFSQLKEKGVKVGLDPKTTPSAIYKFLEQIDLPFLALEDPCVLPKSLKTEKEISHVHQAHIWDGVALVKFMAWLEEEVPKGTVTEFSSAEKLNGFRQENPHLKSLSFETISAVGPNSAMTHYHASEGTSSPLKTGEMYLFDSGGQYFEGTTDVTRTVSLGKKPSKKQKEIFTRVLKGMISLMNAKFPVGTIGTQLDILARQYLWQIGQDYSHSTGHGVGFYLNVHEGPQNISARPLNVPLRPGMILSDEPGCYLENEFGVRIENLMVVKNSELPKTLEFENLTVAPLDASLMDRALLSSEEIDWINAYHRDVYKKLSPLLEKDLKLWLKKATQKLTKRLE